MYEVVETAPSTQKPQAIPPFNCARNAQYNI